MSPLLTTQTAPQGNPQDLQALLLALARYGQPRLGMYGPKGWHCSVEMNTNAVGAAFKVTTEFDLPTPIAAAMQCMERVEAAVKTISGGAA
jgi:hypothetical protein